jgi:DNA-3-methyladenine glycosylase
MPPGTIYMYYARGKDSLSLSCKGAGNALLNKSAFPHEDQYTNINALNHLPHLLQERTEPFQPMFRTNPIMSVTGVKGHRLDQQCFQADIFYLDDIGEQAERIIQTTRPGIPEGRDGHLHYRDFTKYCTSPLNKARPGRGLHYSFIKAVTMSA